MISLHRYKTAAYPMVGVLRWLHAADRLAKPTADRTAGNVVHVEERNAGAFVGRHHRCPLKVLARVLIGNSAGHGEQDRRTG